MKCVKCLGELELRNVGGVEIDQCGSCQGIWFDKRELDRVLKRVARGDDLVPESKASPLSERMDDKRGKCPRCAVKLEKVESIEVESLFYDRCGRCRGVWLDGGELGALTAEPEAAEISAFFAKFE